MYLLPAVYDVAVCSQIARLGRGVTDVDLSIGDARRVRPVIGTCVHVDLKASRAAQDAIDADAVLARLDLLDQLRYGFGSASLKMPSSVERSNIISSSSIISSSAISSLSSSPMTAASMSDE